MGKAAALDQEVRDGKFAFTVTRVDIGTPNVGIHTAQGIFVVVGEDLVNIGPGKQVLGLAR